MLHFLLILGLGLCILIVLGVGLGAAVVFRPWRDGK